MKQANIDVNSELLHTIILIYYRGVMSFMKERKKERERKERKKERKRERERLTELEKEREMRKRGSELKLESSFAS